MQAFNKEGQGKPMQAFNKEGQGKPMQAGKALAGSSAGWQAVAGEGSGHWRTVALKAPEMLVFVCLAHGVIVGGRQWQRDGGMGGLWQ
eukprot:1137858-Pelagomonas_calceolata.AAC.2